MRKVQAIGQTEVQFVALDGCLVHPACSSPITWTFRHNTNISNIQGELQSFLAVRTLSVTGHLRAESCQSNGQQACISLHDAAAEQLVLGHIWLCYSQDSQSLVYRMLMLSHFPDA